MKYIIWILAGAVLILGFSQWRSCEASKLAGHLIAEKKERQHQQDSTNQVQAKIHTDDSILNLVAFNRITRDSVTIDSLSSINKIYEAKYQDIKGRLRKTVSDLSSAVDSGTDSSLIYELNTLKDQLSHADDIVQYIQANSSQKDSIMSGLISFQDSVIGAKDDEIHRLQQNYQSIEALLVKTNADLETAIKQLQKGKRTNILRTIGEALLVIWLLFKK